MKGLSSSTLLTFRGTKDLIENRAIELFKEARKQPPSREHGLKGLDGLGLPPQRPYHLESFEVGEGTICATFRWYNHGDWCDRSMSWTFLEFIPGDND